MNLRNLAIWGLICAPAIVSQPLSIGTWYGFCEALTSLVGTWILYAMMRWQSPGSKMPIASSAVLMASA